MTPDLFRELSFHGTVVQVLWIAEQLAVSWIHNGHTELHNVLLIVFFDHVRVLFDLSATESRRLKSNNFFRGSKQITVFHLFHFMFCFVFLVRRLTTSPSVGSRIRGGVQVPVDLEEKIIQSYPKLNGKHINALVTNSHSLPGSEVPRINLE